MPRPKGEVWKYFQELPEHQNGSLVQCSKCGVRITRGSAEASRGSLNTSSMTDHLRRNHSEVLEKIENSKAEKRKIEEEEEESEMEQGNKTVFKLSSRAKREKFLLNSYKKPQPKNSDVFSKTKPLASESGSGESPTLSSGWSLSSVQYKTDNAWAKEGHLAILKMMVLDM